ncbi:MAG: type II toxin-antitoxin system HicB family antitoxin, partial [bacterium]
MDVKIKLEKDEDGWFVAICPSLPGCVSQGQTEKEAIKNIREAIKLHLRCLAEDGVPIVKSGNTREMILNIA